MTKAVTLGDLAEEARSYVDRGWHRGSLFRRSSGAGDPQDVSDITSVCSLGAVRAAYVKLADVDLYECDPHNRPLYKKAVTMLAEIVNKRAAGRYGSPHSLTYVANIGVITAWNDERIRRKAEVLAVFDDLVEEARKERGRYLVGEEDAAHR